MQIGVCASVSVAKDVPRDGIDYVEEDVDSFLIPDESQALFAKQLRKHSAKSLPVRVAKGFLSGGLMCLGPDADIDRLLTYAERVFERAHAAGIGTIVFDSGRSRMLPRDFPKDLAMDQFVDLLQCFGTAAERYALMLVLKPLAPSECNFVNSHMEAAVCIKKADHPNVQLLIDLCRMAQNGESPRDIAHYGYMVQHVHVLNPMRSGAVSVEKIDFRPYMKALREVGYDAGLSIECDAESLKSTFPRNLSYIREQLTESGY
ncbi:MAG: TIM barrel protein [Kiritimatiellae bacterium]|nr:TIM barrel protein [Kiritimatiellia bacterium]